MKIGERWKFDNNDVFLIAEIIDISLLKVKVLQIKGNSGGYVINEIFTPFQLDNLGNSVEMQNGMKTWQLLDGQHSI